MRVFKRTLGFNGDALSIFAVFKNQPQVFFLDSSLRRGSSRYSYIGFAPFTTIRDTGLSSLKKVYAKYRLPQGSLSFPAGAVGYLGYDGSVYFGLYDTIITLDHQQKKIIISSLSLGKIEAILSMLDCRLPEGVSNEKKPTNRAYRFQSNFTKSQYIKAVQQALEHIRRGDIYQINLSHQIKIDLPNWQKHVPAAVIYQNLRRFFPSEFGAYMDDGKQFILSASPERFLKLHRGLAEVKPMKGTRPRGKTAAEDKQFKVQLRKSPKEIAELLMVTDLERNDLGRVCDFASIKVKAMRSIETYASVFQATSTIQGHLRRDCDQFDLLQATFPSGSVTGCPKIAAMKIIKKLEHGPRGLYTGALGYISFSGDMNFNVMIRTMFLKPNQISFHVGGGIVADSKPQAEWQETWDKAKPMIDTLKKIFV